MISQNQNKLIRSLHQKKFREQHSLFIIEGVRSIKEAINTNAQFEIGISTESFSEKNSDLIRAINPEIVSEEDIKRLSPSVTPSGVLAVYKIPQFNKPNLDQNFIYLDSFLQKHGFQSHRVLASHLPDSPWDNTQKSWLK